MISSENSSERLNLLMRERGMTPTEFALALGVPKSSVSNYLNGKSMMRLKRAEALAPKLGVNPEWLLGCDVPRTPVPSESASWQGAFADKGILSGAASAFAENAGLTPNDRAVIDAYLKAPENIQKAIRTLLNLS